MTHDCDEFMKMLERWDCSETFQLAENLTDEFISTNTCFQNVHEFFIYPFASEDCTLSQLDAYIKSRTHFRSWKDFLYAAWKFNLDPNQ